MAAFRKFDSFGKAVHEGVHDLIADNLKVVLTDTSPLASNTQLSDIVQIANGNGYLTGGEDADVASSDQTAGVYKLVLEDVIFTATGAVGPFRFAVLYNDDAANDELIGFWDYEAELTLANGETFKVDYDPTTGVIQHQ